MTKDVKEKGVSKDADKLRQIKKEVRTLLWESPSKFTDVVNRFSEYVLKRSELTTNHVIENVRKDVEALFVSPEGREDFANRYPLIKQLRGSVDVVAMPFLREFTKIREKLKEGLG